MMIGNQANWGITVQDDPYDYEGSEEQLCATAIIERFGRVLARIDKDREDRRQGVLKQGKTFCQLD